MTVEFQKLNINGTEYETIVPERRKRMTRSADSTKIRALIPGLITEVLVSAGQSVEQGTHLMAIEAMKMENSVRAERNGVIARVHVKTGDLVVRDQLLVEIDMTIP